MKHIKSYENNKEEEFVIIKVNNFYSTLKILRRYLSNTGEDYVEVKQLYKKTVEQKIKRKFNFSVVYLEDKTIYKSNDLTDCLEAMETIIQQDKYNL